jgi:hypothetical protein
MVYNPEVKFNFNEPNFIGFLDLELLKYHFKKLDYRTNFSQYVEELCINIPSLLIMLDRLEEAELCIQKTKAIVSHYDLKSTKAKMLIIHCSVLLKQHATYHDVVHPLD